MSEKKISPILLAAGQSQRFGSDKLLHRFSYNNGDKPLIVHTLTSWLSVFDQLSIVVRPDNHPLIELLKSSEFSSQLQLVYCDNAAIGMSASLVSGIQANKDADAWLIGLADMPFINSAVITESKKLLQSNATITVPIYENRRGHPVGFSSQFMSQLLALTGDKGAKEILISSSDSITFIESPDNGIWRDIDTQDSFI